MWRREKNGFMSFRGEEKWKERKNFFNFLRKCPTCRSVNESRHQNCGFLTNRPTHKNLVKKLRNSFKEGQFLWLKLKWSGFIVALNFLVFWKRRRRKNTFSKALSSLTNLRLNGGVLILDVSWIRWSSIDDVHASRLRRAAHALKPARVRGVNVCDLAVGLRRSSLVI